MSRTRWLALLSLTIALPLTLSGCEVSTCKDGEDCVDVDFDDDGGSDESEMDASVDDDDAGTAKPDSGTKPNPTIMTGASVDLDGDGTTDGKAIDTNKDGKADGVDVNGDGKVDVPLPAAAGPTLSAFCDGTRRVRTAWSDQISACCMNASSAESAASEIDKILDLFGPADATKSCLEPLQPLVRTGRIAYAADKAEACLAAYLKPLAAPPTTCPSGEGFKYWDLATTVGKGLASREQIGACREALAGTVASGGECTSHFECKDSLRCLAVSADRSTCQPALGNGAPCARTSECEAGLTCAGSTASGGAGRSCIPATSLKLNGGGCSTNFECDTGLYCDLTEQKCAAAPQVGATPASCTESLQCQGWCDTASKKCAPLCIP